MKAVSPTHALTVGKSGRARCAKCKRFVAKGERCIEIILRYKYQRSMRVYKLELHLSYT